MAKNVAIDSTSVVIAGSATTSSAVTVPANKRLLAFITPSALTGTSFTFQMSFDSGTTYVPVYNEATLYTVNVGTSRYARVVGDVFDGAMLIKIVSTSTETASRTLPVIFGEY